MPPVQSVDLARSALRDLRYPLPKLRTSAAPDLRAHDLLLRAGLRRAIGRRPRHYRHVDHLNGAGIPAAVMHRRGDFRCSWFENRTRVVGSRETGNRAGRPRRHQRTRDLAARPAAVRLPVRRLQPESASHLATGLRCGRSPYSPVPRPRGDGHGIEPQPADGAVRGPECERAASPQQHRSQSVLFRREPPRRVLLHAPRRTGAGASSLRHVERAGDPRRLGDRRPPWSQGARSRPAPEIHRDLRQLRATTRASAFPRPKRWPAEPTRSASMASRAGNIFRPEFSSPVEPGDVLDLRAQSTGDRPGRLGARMVRVPGRGGVAVHRRAVLARRASARTSSGLSVAAGRSLKTAWRPLRYADRLTDLAVVDYSPGAAGPAPKAPRSVPSSAAAWPTEPDASR